MTATLPVMECSVLRRKFVRATMLAPGAARSPPYARTSLYEEIAGAVLPLIAAWALARPRTRQPLPG